MQLKLSSKLLELKLYNANKAFNTNTSSYKYFVLQIRVQEAT